MTRATTFRTTAIIGAFLLALLMIMTVSRAAFSDPTSNDANYVAAGSVVLDNDAPNGGENTSPGDESGDPMFGAAAGVWTVDAGNLAPGESVDHCIDIQYKGSLDATVALDSVQTTGAVTVADFDGEINLTIERFAGSACSGTATAVAGGTLATPSISEIAWSATGGVPTDVVSYEITLELDSDAGNEFQGASISDIEFEWLATQS
ncbi:MAG: hypothetical protein WCC01_14175 [Acidimicrobiia bacterium]